MKKIINRENLLLFIPLTILITFSLFGMYQSKFIKSVYNLHLYKQILWFCIGIVIIFILKKIKISFLFRYSFQIYLVSNILLLLVLFFGRNINGSKAWFYFKFFNFQPSEFMKYSLLLYLCNEAYLTEKPIKNEFMYIFKMFIITLIPSILVFLEPDTGAILIYFLLLFSVLMLSDIKKRWFAIAFLTLGIFITLFFYLYFLKQDLFIKFFGTSFFYRIDRIINFKNGEGLQLNYALTTIGNSGLLGHGIQNDLLYVPEFPTDFIFTLIISIFGFIGASQVIISYALIDIFLINNLFKINNQIAKLFINGFIFMFIFQQIQNILMNIGLLPIMGIPLPFLSYGGSNLLIYFMFLGTMLNLLKHKKNKI